MHGVNTKLFKEVRSLETLITLLTYMAYNHQLGAEYTMVLQAIQTRACSAQSPEGYLSTARFMPAQILHLRLE